jgi:hypothetical protein
VGRPVGVDPVGLGLGVGDDLAASAAVGLDEQVGLVAHQPFALRAGHERLSAEHQPEGIDTRNVGDGGTRRPASERQEQAAIARRDPAGPERDVVAGLAMDVGDAVLVVEDGEPRSLGGLLTGGADRREVLGDEVLVDVRFGDVAPQRGQTVVERELIARLVRGG